LDWDEVFFGVEIVFAGLVDHANLVQLGCGFIRDNLIELPPFERGGIALVLDANGELRFSFLH
jgi:hypothetical protein